MELPQGLGSGYGVAGAGADELREAWRIFTPLLDQIDGDEPQPGVHEFQTVLPPGVKELASKIGMVFNPLANSGVADAKL